MSNVKEKMVGDGTSVIPPQPPRNESEPNTWENAMATTMLNTKKATMPRGRARENTRKLMTTAMRPPAGTVSQNDTPCFISTAVV